MSNALPHEAYSRLPTFALCVSLSLRFVSFYTFITSPCEGWPLGASWVIMQVSPRNQGNGCPGLCGFNAIGAILLSLSISKLFSKDEQGNMAWRIECLYTMQRVKCVLCSTSFIATAV